MSEIEKETKLFNALNEVLIFETNASQLTWGQVLGTIERVKIKLTKQLNEEIENGGPNN